MVFGGLLFGFLVGVALVAGFKYLSDKRRKARIRKVLGLYSALCTYFGTPLSASLALWY
jgi:hypothetical protein